MYVMRFHRNRFDNLLVERDPAGRAAHGNQQLVIKPFAPAKPTPLQVESYTRHQNQVQSVRRYCDTMRARLANPELPMIEILRNVLDLASHVSLGGGIKAGQGDRFAGCQ